MQFVRTFGGVALTGVAAVIALKLIAAVLVPLLGLLLGFAALVFKVGLFVAVGFFLYRMFRRRRDAATA